MLRPRRLASEFGAGSGSRSEKWQRVPHRLSHRRRSRLPKWDGFAVTDTWGPLRCAPRQRWRRCGRPSSRSWTPFRRTATARTIATWTATPCTIWPPSRPSWSGWPCLYGPDLLLWRTNFFVKNRGSKAIPWHQDFNYWPLEPPVIISAWIAVDPSTRQNGNLQVIPGSHRSYRPAHRGHPRRAVRGDGGCRLLRSAQPDRPGDAAGRVHPVQRAHAAPLGGQPLRACAASGWRCARSSRSSRCCSTTPTTTPCR